MDTFEYTVSTKKNFDFAVDAIVNETEKAGFRVLYIHDVQDTLFKKGFTIKPLKIVEICNAKNAYAAIEKNIALALILPCKINVYLKGGKVFISALRPTVIKEIFPTHDIDYLLTEVDEKMKIIVENSK